MTFVSFTTGVSFQKRLIIIYEHLVEVFDQWYTKLVKNPHRHSIVNRNYVKNRSTAGPCSITLFALLFLLLIGDARAERA